MQVFLWGLFTWPNPDDQMNLTEIVTMTKKLTTTNINMVKMTENIINITTTMNINGWI